MRRTPKNWPTSMLIARKDRIDPKPQYQRTPVWNLAKKQRLIDTMLREFDIPKIYLAISSEANFDHEIVDGQQRIRSIWEFHENAFALGDISKDLPLGDLSGLKYSELPNHAKDLFDLYEFSLIILEDVENSEVRDQFLRLQEGVSLNPAEKRNAMEGQIRDFICALGEEHKVFSLTHINSKRYAWHDLAAIVTCCEIEGGPTDIKAPSLKSMYEQEQRFNVNGAKAKRIKKILNYMKGVLSTSPPEMKIKWGFVDLYLLISKLDSEYIIGSREEDFLDFFVSFENERQSNEDPADLLIGDPVDPWNQDLFNYIQAFQQSGGRREAVEVRHQVYMKRALRDMNNLVPKDSRRLFTHDERIILWRRENQSCKICGNNILFEDMQADHIIPYSEGGQTTIQNGQSLCIPCHQQKTANG